MLMNFDGSTRQDSQVEIQGFMHHHLEQLSAEADTQACPLGGGGGGGGGGGAFTHLLNDREADQVLMLQPVGPNPSIAEMHLSILDAAGMQHAISIKPAHCELPHTWVAGFFAKVTSREDRSAASAVRRLCWPLNVAGDFLGDK